MSKNKPNRPVAKPLFTKPVVKQTAESISRSEHQALNQQLEVLSQQFKQAYAQQDFNIPQTF